MKNTKKYVVSLKQRAKIKCLGYNVIQTMGRIRHWSNCILCGTVELRYGVERERILFHRPVIWIVLNTHILFLSQINALTRPFYSPTQWTIGCWWGKKGNLAIVNFEYISYDKFFNIRDPQTPSFDCHLTGHLFSQALKKTHAFAMFTGKK